MSSSTPDLSQARYGTLLRLLWGHVQPRRRVQMALLVALMLLSSFAELLTVASLVPFLVVLSDPSRLWRQPLVRSAAEILGFSGPHQLILPITLLLMAVGVISAAIRGANLFVNARLSALIGSDLGVEGYRRTLEQPYAVHLGRNSSEVITQLAYLGGISRGILAPLLQGLSGLIVAVVLVAGLLAYQPTLAMGLAAVFLAIYGAMARLNRRRLHRISVLSDQYSQRSLKAQQEGLGAIREVLLDRSQPLLVDTYRRAQRPLMLLQAEADTVAGLPRYALEAAGMAAIAGSVLWLLPRGGVVAALPAVGAIALGFQRLLPAMQQMYGASTYLGAYRDALAGGLELLEQPRAPQVFSQSAGPIDQPEALPFQQGLEFRQVDFCHQGGVAVLHGIDLTIRPGAWIGLVGATGSGKSTLVDLLMGLLSPSRGQILVDGLPLEEQRGSIDRRPSWQRHLAHVPQTIFLADASIAENIAFGVAPELIDRDRLGWAAAYAQAEDFITALPQGLDTPVGERGVRLSGGQRQRLGIARALYKRADVLILDEATSALDTLTEQRVLEAIAGLGPEYTVVMIAHRLSTVTQCERIIELKAGHVHAQGCYEELLRISPSFRQLSTASQV
ncbi:MAG: ABC transporter ATP-binding protein [Synechococcaceae cyanobacterium ELA445]